MHDWFEKRAPPRLSPLNSDRCMLLMKTTLTDDGCTVAQGSNVHRVIHDPNICAILPDLRGLLAVPPPREEIVA